MGVPPPPESDRGPRRPQDLIRRARRSQGLTRKGSCGMTRGRVPPFRRDRRGRGPPLPGTGLGGATVPGEDDRRRAPCWPDGLTGAVSRRSQRNDGGRVPPFPKGLTWRSRRPRQGRKERGGSLRPLEADSGPTVPLPSASPRPGPGPRGKPACQALEGFPVRSPQTTYLGPRELSDHLAQMWGRGGASRWVGRWEEAWPGAGRGSRRWAWQGRNTWPRW